MTPDFFRKGKIPESLPEGMTVVISDLKNLTNKEECLKQAYDILSEKYRGYRIETYLKLFNLFESNLNKIWNRSGFLHCNTLNYLLRILLIKSGFFSEEDIKLKWTLVYYISPHQYLRIKTDKGEWVNIDLWGKTYGIKFGNYAHGFNSRLFSVKN